MPFASVSCGENKLFRPLESLVSRLVVRVRVTLSPEIAHFKFHDVHGLQAESNKDFQVQDVTIYKRLRAGKSNVNDMQSSPPYEHEAIGSPLPS